MLTLPVIFSFHETYDVRVQLINAEPWFCLRDVCEVLNISNARDLLSKQLDKKGVDKIYTLTEGGKQELSYINEPNLYRVIFRSNKPEAKEFQNWVFNEVLPQIRKTGSYQHPQHQPEAPELLSKNDDRNLARLVWRISNGFRFKRSWSNAVWFALRDVTGTASPQRFEVQHIPLLAQECRRIYYITSRFQDIIQEAEKQVIRRLLRKREDTETVLSEMKELFEASVQENYFTLTEKLDHWHEREVSQFLQRH